MVLTRIALLQKYLEQFLLFLFFCFPFACSEGWTFHHPYLKETLFRLLAFGFFFVFYVEQTREYHQGQFYSYRNGLWLSLLFFFFWAVITVRETSYLAISPLLNLFCVLLIVLGLTRLFAREERCWRIVFFWGSVVASGLYSISFIENTFFFTGQPAHGFERPFYNPNAIALFLLYPFFLGGSLWSNTREKKFLGGLALIFLALFLAKSEGAWLGLICGVLSYFLLRVSSLFTQKNFSGGFVLVALITSFLVLPVLLEFVAHKNSSETVLIRYEIYKGSVDTWLDSSKESTSQLQKTPFWQKVSFWMGYGWGCFRSYYGPHRTIEYQLLDLSVSNTHSPHNFQWDILIGTGLIGLGLFYLILWFYFQYGSHLLAKMTRLEEKKSVALEMAAMVALLVHGLVAHFFFSVFNLFILAVLISSMNQRYRKYFVQKPPYPHYLLARPSKKQQQFDWFLLIPFLGLSLIFWIECIWTPLKAEYALKQASRSQNLPAKEREYWLKKALSSPYESETRYVARMYLMDVYQELAQEEKQMAVYYQEETLKLAETQEKFYPHSGNTLLVLATCRQLLNYRPLQPGEKNALDYFVEYAIAFPFEETHSAWLQKYMLRPDYRERLVLQQLLEKLSLIYEQIHPKEIRDKFFHSTSSVGSSEYPVKVSLLSYTLYVLSRLTQSPISPEEWLKTCFYGNPQHHGFCVLLAKWYFEKKQMEKAQQVLLYLSSSQLEYQMKKLTHPSELPFRDFLKQQWNTLSK